MFTIAYCRLTLGWGLLAALQLWLSACSYRSPEGPALTWPQRQQQLQQLTHYQARGSVIYRTAKHVRYARFNWQQRAPDHIQWRLIHPLGQTLLLLEQQGSSWRLQDHQGEQHHGQQAEQYLKQQSGLILPLPLLARWLVGLPTPHDHYQLNAQQQLQRLTHPPHPLLQVNYLAYREQGGVSLPAQLQLEIDGQQILLKIDQWTISP